MDLEDDNVYEVTIINQSQCDPLSLCETATCSTTDSTDPDPQKSETHSNNNEITEKHSAVWTTNATSTLLKLYEDKLEMLETPKKKTRIWIAISESLKNYNIEMSPDQVRWKINALTKKYKQCIDNGQHEKFKYFKEMDNIYAHYNVDCDTYTSTEILQKKEARKNHHSISADSKSLPESKAMIELRKIRLADRIESDRSQSKIQLEKQWLEYLRRQEEQKCLRDEMFERNLKLKEEELELRKRELEMKESLEYKKLQLKEKEQEEMLQIEKEKCEMLKKIFGYNY